MRILSFVVRVVVESNEVNADKLTDEVNEVLREYLPEGDTVSACLVEAKLICNEAITYNDGVDNG